MNTQPETTANEETDILENEEEILAKLQAMPTAMLEDFLCLVEHYDDVRLLLAVQADPAQMQELSRRLLREKAYLLAMLADLRGLILEDEHKRQASGGL